MAAKRWATVSLLALLAALMLGVDSRPVCVTCPVQPLPFELSLPECGK